MKKPNQFGSIVASQRKRKQLSQESLSDLCQVSVRYISSVETNQANPTLKVMTRMAQVLGIKALYFDKLNTNQAEDNSP